MIRLSWALLGTGTNVRLLHNGPILAAEYARVMETLAVTPSQRIAIAVSGGVDSIALLRLTAEWYNGPLLALSVNHDIRPEAADEVAWVSEQCRQIGRQTNCIIHHITLKIAWPEDQSLPYSKLQAAARQARYQLLGQACDQHRIDQMLVAHHLNDQVETFLLRFARASGIEGLGCMYSRSRSTFGTVIVRPLLSFPKQRLQATCRERFNQAWREDPSNQNMAFDRVRVRSVVNRLPEELLQHLYRTTQHMQRLQISVAKLCQSIILESCTWVHPISACWVNISKLRQNRSVTRSVLTEIFKAMSLGSKLKLKSLNDFVDYIYEDTEFVYGFRDMFNCRIRRFPGSIQIVPDYTRCDRSNHLLSSNSITLSNNIRWGSAEFQPLSASLTGAYSCLPLTVVWRQLRNQMKSRNYIERLPQSLPSFLKESNPIAVVCNQTERVVAVPALPGILLDLTFSSRPII